MTKINDLQVQVKLIIKITKLFSVYIWPYHITDEYNIRDTKVDIKSVNKNILAVIVEELETVKGSQYKSVFGQY